MLHHLLLATSFYTSNQTFTSVEDVNTFDWYLFPVSSVLTCVFAAVHLQVRKLEVAFVAPWVGAHERALLAAFRAHNRRGDAGDPPNILHMCACTDTDTQTHTHTQKRQKQIKAKIQQTSSLGTNDKTSKLKKTDN